MADADNADVHELSGLALLHAEDDESIASIGSASAEDALSTACLYKADSDYTDTDDDTFGSFSTVENSPDAVVDRKKFTPNTETSVSGSAMLSFAEAVQMKRSRSTKRLKRGSVRGSEAVPMEGPFSLPPVQPNRRGHTRSASLGSQNLLDAAMRSRSNSRSSTGSTIKSQTFADVVSAATDKKAVRRGSAPATMDQWKAAYVV